MTVDTLIRNASPNPQADNSPRKDVCLVCNKVVYPMDKIAADDKIFHKTCLRCGHCNKVLSLGNYAALNSVFYCKPHFKQLFALKGNYSDGFKASAAASGASETKIDKSSESLAKSQEAIVEKSAPTEREPPKVETSVQDSPSRFAPKPEPSSTPSKSDVPRSSSLAERMNALTQAKSEAAPKKETISDYEAPRGNVADRLGMFGKLNGSQENLTLVSEREAPKGTVADRLGVFGKLQESNKQDAEKKDKKESEKREETKNAEVQRLSRDVEVGKKDDNKDIKVQRLTKELEAEKSRATQLEKENQRLQDLSQVEKDRSADSEKVIQRLKDLLEQREQEIAELKAAQASSPAPDSSETAQSP